MSGFYDLAKEDLKEFIEKFVDISNLIRKNLSTSIDLAIELEKIPNGVNVLIKLKDITMDSLNELVKTLESIGAKPLSLERDGEYFSIKFRYLG